MFLKLCLFVEHFDDTDYWYFTFIWHICYKYLSQSNFSTVEVQNFPFIQFDQREMKQNRSTKLKKRLPMVNQVSENPWWRWSSSNCRQWSTKEPSQETKEGSLWTSNTSKPKEKSETECV